MIYGRNYGFTTEEKGYSGPTLLGLAGLILNMGGQDTDVPYTQRGTYKNKTKTNTNSGGQIQTIEDKYKQ